MAKDPRWEELNRHYSDACVLIDKLRAERDEALSRLAAERGAEGWEPIATAPRGAVLDFWIRPLTADEGVHDTSGKPIYGNDVPPRVFRGRYGTWSALWTATHWRPLPPPPASSSGDGIE